MSGGYRGSCAVELLKQGTYCTAHSITWMNQQHKLPILLHIWNRLVSCEELVKPVGWLGG